MISTRATGLGAALAFAATLHAGPPFQTDDPEPVDFRHYEFYTFATPMARLSKPTPLAPPWSSTGALSPICNCT